MTEKHESQNQIEFVMPKAEVIVFDDSDVITTSGGGFPGDWDVDLPKIDV